MLANKIGSSHIGYAAFQQAGYHFYPKQIHSVPNHIGQKESITELSTFLNDYICWFHFIDFAVHIWCRRS